jgi:hypothetical protein
MSRMRREYSQEYPIVVTVLNKTYSNVRSIAIKDKEPVGASSLSFSLPIKHLFKLPLA